MPANIAISLPPHLKDALDKVSTRSGVPRATIIARLLERYLSGTGPGLPEVRDRERPSKPPQARRVSKFVGAGYRRSDG